MLAAITAVPHLVLLMIGLLVVGAHRLQHLRYLARAEGILQTRGFQVISIASPLLKCEMPGSPPVDERFQHDVFASRHTFEDQPRLAEHAFEIARRFGQESSEFSPTGER
jgi:hypothetical protein